MTKRIFSPVKTPIAAVALLHVSQGMDKNEAVQEAVKAFSPVFEVPGDSTVISALKHLQKRQVEAEVAKIKAAGESTPSVKAATANITNEDTRMFVSDILKQWAKSLKEQSRLADKLRKANSKAVIARKKAERLRRQADEADAEAERAEREEAEEEGDALSDDVTHQLPDTEDAPDVTEDSEGDDTDNDADGSEDSDIEEEDDLPSPPPAKQKAKPKAAAK